VTIHATAAAPRTAAAAVDVHSLYDGTVSAIFVRRVATVKVHRLRA
jgi:hypothetical protein